MLASKLRQCGNGSLLFCSEWQRGMAACVQLVGCCSLLAVVDDDERLINDPWPHIIISAAAQIKACKRMGWRALDLS